MFVLKKKYEALSKENLNLSLENNKLEGKLKAKEYFLKQREDEIKLLYDANETLFLDNTQQENEIEILNQEIQLYKKTIEELENKKNEVERVNKSLWVNKEGIRQLRNLSKEIRKADKVDKKYIANYIDQISVYMSSK